MSSSITTETAAAFPVGTAVIIQNLVKNSQYNGGKGLVLTPLDPSSLRQNVFVANGYKTMSIKPVNLKIDPHYDGPIPVEKLRAFHQLLGSNLNDKKSKSGIPSWYRGLVTPNNPNQFMVFGDVNQRRKPDQMKQMLGIDSDTYWQGGGKYQDLFDELVESLPPRGKAATKAGEIIRAANKLMYDLWNNHMMNNTSSALQFLARQGVFPNAGGDKVYATIYPYSLGPRGNTPFVPEEGNHLCKAIERMVDISCKYIIDNPHLKTAENTEDMTFGPQLAQMMSRLNPGETRNAEENDSESGGAGKTDDKLDMDTEIWKDEIGLLQTVQLAREEKDNGGCIHGRPRLTLLGKDGFKFVSYCEEVWDKGPANCSMVKLLLTVCSVKDAEKMKVVRAYLKASATSFYLEGEMNKAAGLSACLLAVEDLTVFDESRMKELLDGDRDTIATFLSTQITCSCLDRRKPKALCQYCNKADRSKLLQQCSACFSVSYCSRECQRDDWRNHKKSCKRISARKK